MTVIFTIFILVFTALTITEIISIGRTNKYASNCEGHFDSSFVSIIIPARNEEKNIGSLLESINVQDDDNFEVIVIVDRCTDETREIAEEYSVEARYELKIVLNSDDPSSGQNPKVGLLQMGMAHASGAIYLFTDADCVLPNDWISSYRQLFSDPETGLIFGALEVASGSSLLEQYQNFDHIYRSFYAAACAGAMVPTGGFGNNIGIRRECYESLGGFECLPKSVTEDAVLVSSVGRSADYNVRALSTFSKRVKTLPQHTIKSYIQQSSRWAAGAVHSTDKKTYVYYNLLMTALTITNLSLLLSLILPQLIIIPLIGYIYCFGSAIIAGFLLKANRSYWMSLIPSVFLFFFFYQISFIKTLFHQKIIWKNTTLLAR